MLPEDVMRGAAQADLAVAEVGGVEVEVEELGLRVPVLELAGRDADLPASPRSPPPTLPPAPPRPLPPPPDRRVRALRGGDTCSGG